MSGAATGSRCPHESTLQVRGSALPMENAGLRRQVGSQQEGLQSEDWRSDESSGAEDRRSGGSAWVGHTDCSGNSPARQGVPAPETVDRVGKRCGFGGPWDLGGWAGTGRSASPDAHALSRAPSQHRRRGLWATVSPIAGAYGNNLTCMGRQSENQGLQRLHTYNTNISGSRIRDEEGTSSSPHSYSTPYNTCIPITSS